MLLQDKNRRQIPSLWTCLKEKQRLLEQKIQSPGCTEVSKLNIYPWGTCHRIYHQVSVTEKEVPRVTFGLPLGRSEGVDLTQQNGKEVDGEWR